MYKLACDDCKECLEMGVDYCLHLISNKGGNEDEKHWS